MVGLFSLGLGVVLFLLILVRGQQAAREGNQEIRNDTYWVLVSPLVFSAFGVGLLRAPKGGVQGRAGRRTGQPVVMRPQVSRALQQSQRAARTAQSSIESVSSDTSEQLVRARAEAAAALASLQSLEADRARAADQAAARIQLLERDLESARQARSELEADLRRSLVSQSSDTSGTLAAMQLVEGQVDQLATGLNDQMASARLQLDQLIDRQEDQLNRLRSEATEARNALDQLRANQDSQLSRVRSEATAAITAAQAAQARSQQLTEGVSERMATMDQQIQQAQQSCARAEATLGVAVANSAKVQAEARAGADQSQRRVDELAGSLAAQMDQARQKLDAALQASQDAQTLVDRLEQSVFAAPPSAVASVVANAITDPFLSCYREACEELGVLPGSPWQDVRATWRRNLLHWHPDQGGDPKLWSRRNAAYQLLVAWYEFNGVS
ncbi:MAG: hypothetical protein WD136_05475 [Cyanobium sp.]